MNRKKSCILALILTTLIATTVLIFAPEDQARETVLVAKVIDGDTLTLEDGRKIRLANINSPEKDSLNYELPSNYLKAYENQTIEIEIIDRDRYYRELARIYSKNKYLNLEIVKQGLANKFLVQEDEIKEFAAAEKSAIDNKLGIWKRSSHYGCIESTIDEQDEFVILMNSCSTINIQDWTIKDESTKEYKFGDLGLQVIRIHSTNGQNTEEDIYWNSKTNVWNNDRDSLFLFDDEGKLVHYNTYGY